jgi:hypothetical protein
MQNTVRKKRSWWIVVIMAVSLSMLGLVSIPLAEAQTGAGTVCVLQITADGPVLSVLVDQPQGFNIAVLVPEDKDKKVNIPITCESLETLGLGVTNQKNVNVNFAVKVLTNQGASICSKGPFLLPVNGGRGVSFSDCP